MFEFPPASLPVVRSIRPCAALVAALTAACDGRSPAPDPTRVEATRAAASGRDRTAASNRTDETVVTDRAHTIVVATVGDPGPLVPPLVASIGGAQIVDMLFERLAEPAGDPPVLGTTGYAPSLATAWRWSADSLAIAFTLDSTARWHDGRPVTSADVRLSFALYRDAAIGAAAAAALADVDSVSAPGPHAVVVHFRRRTPRMLHDATYHVHVLPAHRYAGARRDALLDDALVRAPIGSGRFRLVRAVPGQLVELRAVAGHRAGAPRIGRLVWRVYADPAGATRALRAGEVDVWEALAPHAIPEVARAAHVRVRAYPSLDVGYLAFNLRDPQAPRRPHAILAEHAVRRALAHAIDRATATRAVFDTLAHADGVPVPRAVLGWRTDASGPAFDPQRARRSLDSLGWREPDAGHAARLPAVRRRGGRPLAFELLVPASSASRVRYAQLLQAQLAAVGVRVTIAALEPSQFYDRVDAGRFEAALLAMHADPAPDALGQLWGTRGPGGRGAQNVTGYRSVEFERLLDAAAGERDRTRAAAAYGRAIARLADDVPAVWLFELRNAMGHHARLVPTALRGDAWWGGLPDWGVQDAAALATARRAGR